MYQYKVYKQKVGDGEIIGLFRTDFVLEIPTDWIIIYGECSYDEAQDYLHDLKGTTKPISLDSLDGEIGIF